MKKRPLPAAVRLPLTVYRTLFPLAFALMLPGVLLRMIRRGGYRAQFGQRFGRYTPEAAQALKDGGWTWIHAVSVGEMMMALKLARALQEAQPGIRLLISTTTSTGFAVAQEQRSSLPQAIEVIYYPLDLTSIVRKVLDTVQPERLVLVDKELWPNLVSECYRRSIPITIVNARISPRSERRIRKAKRWVAPFYGLLGRVCLQDEADRARWEAVGVHPEALECTGSLKFDLPAATASTDDLEPLREILKAINASKTEHGPVLLGGSTFAGEEELLARLLIALRDRWPGMLLILVPRHVERTAEVVAMLKGLGLTVQLRKEAVPTGSRPDVLVVNTTGELARWYALADLCYIGKSLAPGFTGGQNPAEPIFADRPVIFGPHMQNFEPLVTQMIEAGGATQVADADALAVAVQALLNDPAIGAVQVQRAKAVLTTHQGAIKRIVRAILSDSDSA